MEWTPNARLVLEARYLRRDREGRVAETPDGLLTRVAAAVAEGERLMGNAAGVSRWRERFHRLLASLDFLPNSPTLMNAGTSAGQLSACFVLPVPDTMEGIFEAVKEMALVQRTGGGTGFSFSRLRPRGDLVASTGGESSGPVSFMRIFDCATGNIRQGGRRRGANMGVLRVDHPDIIEFIEAKRAPGTLENFNLSVGVTDAFMAAVRDHGPFALRHPSTGRAVETVPARSIFDAMVESAWSTGDPGLLFLDAINRGNPTPMLGRIEATNPCGEVPLLPHESCTLGSIHLPRMLVERDGVEVTDWERLERTVGEAVRFLDDVIEVNRYPTPAMAELARGNRKIGLGVMGFAEMLIRLGIGYGSSGAVEFAGRLMAFISCAALDASEALAVERGVFPNWRGSRWESLGRRIRNATCTAIAPTGTISIIAGTTPGIEPLFALAYRRVNVLEGRTLVEINPLLRGWLERQGIESGAVLREVERQGHLAGAPGINAEARRLFATALEIDPERHLEIQAACQRHTDNSVSKTINLPRDATRADIAGIWLRAFAVGLKGITIYRYGSKPGQVLELGVGESPGIVEHASRCDPGECRL